jgi:hypothetical protein
MEEISVTDDNARPSIEEVSELREAAELIRAIAVMAEEDATHLEHGDVGRSFVMAGVYLIRRRFGDEFCARYLQTQVDHLRASRELN